jgi:hypothetical protein
MLIKISNTSSVLTWLHSMNCLNSIHWWICPVKANKEFLTVLSHARMCNMLESMWFVWSCAACQYFWKSLSSFLIPPYSRQLFLSVFLLWSSSRYCEMFVESSQLMYVSIFLQFLRSFSEVAYKLNISTYIQFCRLIDPLQSWCFIW